MSQQLLIAVSLLDIEKVYQRKYLLMQYNSKKWVLHVILPKRTRQSFGWTKWFSSFVAGGDQPRSSKPSFNTKPWHQVPLYFLHKTPWTQTHRPRARLGKPQKPTWFWRPKKLKFEAIGLKQEKNGSLIFFYSTCCGQGTWSLLQRKVRKAKEAGLRMSKYVQSEPFRNQHKVQSMIRCTIKDELERITWCRETKSYAKNLPKALTAVLSPSRTEGRAPQGSSNWHGRSRRRGGVAFAARVCSPSFVFFLTTTKRVRDQGKKECTPWNSHWSI